MIFTAKFISLGGREYPSLAKAKEAGAPRARLRDFLARIADGEPVEHQEVDRLGTEFHIRTGEDSEVTSCDSHL